MTLYPRLVHNRIYISLKRVLLSILTKDITSIIALLPLCKCVGANFCCLNGMNREGNGKLQDEPLTVDSNNPLLFASVNDSILALDCKGIWHCIVFGMFV